MHKQHYKDENKQISKCKILAVHCENLSEI